MTRTTRIAQEFPAKQKRGKQNALCKTKKLLCLSFKKDQKEIF